MRKFFQILLPVLLIALIVTSIGWYLFVYDRDFTRDVLLSQARYQDEHGNSRLSEWFYSLAYEYSGRDENVSIELANQYKADGNYTKAEVTLSKAIYSSPTAELYAALCQTYVEQDKLLDAVALLESIPDQTIFATLDAQRPVAPTANYASGFYSEYIEVALVGDEGTLYYTTDGKYPSIQNEPYSEPITLSAGETIIYAITVDENGLVSPLTILDYTVGGVIEPAVFTDAAMEASVRELLGIAEGKTIYTDELWEITEFTLPEGTTSLDDLALLPYLKTLTVSGKTLESLGGLSPLTALETLNITQCSFPAEELSTIAALPALRELTVSDCSISTVAGLENAAGLRKLDISNNTVRNLEPLSGLTSLQELNMAHNALTGLDAIAGLTNLETLDISYNSVTTCAPLSTLVRLTSLDASNNQLYNLDGITQLTLLESLALDYNALTDVSGLAALTGLTTLSISNNAITDLSALSVLEALTNFDFSYNQVTALPAWSSSSSLQIVNGSYNALTSIDVLGSLSELSYVNMDYNAITNIDALAGCYNLVQINVYGNEIESVSALTERNIIVNYDPT